MKYNSLFWTLPALAVTATTIPTQEPLHVTLPSLACNKSSVPAEGRYKGIKHNTGNVTRLRISNGGAGQSGLVEALAKAYIDFSVDNGIAKDDYVIDWVVGDTTDSINYLATGDADIAITYNAAAEYRAGNLSIAKQRVYGFRDHFYLVGPEYNPAGLTWNSTTKNDSVHDMFNKIVTTGNAATGTRFLSRYDKSATNIKESLLFAEIGQIPWAYAYSKWYHQYPQFPIPSLIAASLLQEYTLSDRGTYLTLQASDPTIANKLVIYKRGGDVDPADALLNPAAVLLGGKVCQDNEVLAREFVSWMIAKDGGQKVVREFKKPGTTELLYTEAPDCVKEPAQCVGW